ncbi:MAG TPA: glycosyltransferase, partial [Vicinamibacterales bacterium]|nr:glycosyltransferase [Vicinamibacterales bacterium]
MRILLAQRSMRPPGGGNAVAAWMVHALAGAHEVATVTAAGWSPAETNAFYGTAIPPDITRHVTSAPWSWLAPLPEDRLTRLRMCSVLHSARRLASQFDLLITADNFAAFPKPGLQYVHFPAPLQPEPARLSALVRPYFALCDRLLGAPWSEARRNVTIANSQWTADGLARLGEISNAHVLHPPVVDPGEGLPWERRDNTFLCIGRFSPTKRIEMAIAIVERIRASSLPDAKLIVIGSPVDESYTERVRGLAARGSWIEIKEDLPREEVNALMRRSRFGIHAMVGEHFGMATAEMARAGCLVFAHNSGGTPEVLNHDSALLW